MTTDPQAARDVMAAVMAAFAKAFDVAVAHDMARIEANTAARQARAAALAAAPKRCAIALEGRIGRQAATLYVSGVSFKDGDGWAVSRIKYTERKDQAQEFRAVAADGIARYLIACGFRPSFV